MKTAFRSTTALALLSLFLLSLLSCEKDDRDSTVHPVVKDKVSGFVQKGPFINGTQVSFMELDGSFTQTGRTFNIQIADNMGSFELLQLALASQYVELTANGYYYNEVLGEPSSGQLTLYALSDVEDKSTLNINILTYLERDRIRYLMSQGDSFGEAKEQAQAEVLEVFSISSPGIAESELLDISKDGDDNAILLAISLILQGYRTEAELSELLANIITDIREDGLLDSESLGNKLVNHARLLDTVEIRQNLESRYDELGVEASIPGFEKYIQLFLDNTPYPGTFMIGYPEFSNYGENVLYEGKDVFTKDVNYSLAAELPRGTQLKIVMKGGLWWYVAMPDAPVNWTISNYDQEEKSQVFTATESGTDCDLKLQFDLIYETPSDTTEGGIYGETIYIDYFENGSATPTRTKTIHIQE